MKPYYLFLFPIFPITVFAIIISLQHFLVRPKIQEIKPISLVSPAPITSPSPSPSEKPLTFQEMNQLYGPCTVTPVLMYHHVQDLEQAKQKNQQNLTVGTAIFRQQMEYLQTHGYVAVDPQSLINFFDQNQSLPAKSVMISFDDGYDDFYSNAFPIINELNLKAVVFLPTGLMNNPGYLDWEQIKTMAQSSKIFFANHTWSHHNVAGSLTEIKKEVTLADTQLTDHGLNQPKVFSYPYGLNNNQDVSFLSESGYQLAFTTHSGSILCKQQRLLLPRIRIGNANLNSYGL